MRVIQSSDAKIRRSELFDGVNRATMPKLTLEEIISARHEGHKY
jgi:hypothetical protein